MKFVVVIKVVRCQLLRLSLLKVNWGDWVSCSVIQGLSQFKLGCEDWGSYCLIVEI